MGWDHGMIARSSMMAIKAAIRVQEEALSLEPETKKMAWRSSLKHKFCNLDKKRRISNGVPKWSSERSKTDGSLYSPNSGRKQLRPSMDCLPPVDLLMHFGPHFAEITLRKTPPLLKKKKSVLKEGRRDDSNNRKW
uniref:Uncharacterized protein n=1 Tax=Salix viminalis TaxID=40686 RepID=A0A6N2MXT1_SALVM